MLLPLLYEVSLHRKNYIILPALTIDGLLHLEVVENVITSDIFWEFV